MRRTAVTLLLFVAISCLPACRTGSYPPYTIGFATPSGNAIWVSAAHFDNHTWGTPVGSIACCWEESGAGSIIFDRPLPKDIYVNWLEKATNTRYEATLVLPKDIDARASRLPGYIHVPSNQKGKARIYLTVGLAPGGEAVVWLSNSNSAKYLSGFVLEVVARTKGTRTEEIAPYYPRANNAAQGAH